MTLHYFQLTLNSRPADFKNYHISRQYTESDNYMPKCRLKFRQITGGHLKPARYLQFTHIYICEIHITIITEIYFELLQ